MYHYQLFISVPSLVHVECIECSQNSRTLGAGVAEGVRVVSALDVVPHIAQRLVRELHAHTAAGHAGIISSHHAIEIFRFGE